MESLNLSRILFPCHSCFRLGDCCQEFSYVDPFGQLSKYLESKYAFTGLVDKSDICSFLISGGKWMPPSRKCECPRGVGVPATISFPEHFSHWVGASGILLLPYKNVDVSSAFLNLDNDGHVPVAAYVPGWEAGSPWDHLFCCLSHIIRVLKTDWSKSSPCRKCINV